MAKRKQAPAPAPFAEAYARLLDAYGPQGWWPEVPAVGPEATGPAAKGRPRQRLFSPSPADADEIAIGAVLVQHTSWKNVEHTIRTLRGANALSLAAIGRLDATELAELVRRSGPPTVKAERLQSLARFVAEAYGGSMAALLAGVGRRAVALERRRELLGVRGVGPETADVILLYAGGAPLFVVDAYTRRVMRRHGWPGDRAPYDDVARWFESQLPADAAVYAEAHALLVRLGVERCGARRADCEGCPLQALLPPGGPVMG